MAIIGKIRKHSGLAVIIIGIAIAAFVIGDFGKKSVKGVNEIGEVNGEVLSYTDFNAKVDQSIEAQKQNSGNDKITDQETYQIRQNTWTQMVKNLIMEEEYLALGMAVSSEELFDQVQGKQPHRFILQYFKDPKTNNYDPALVINYLKNLDQMEPKAKDNWIQFEKAIKEDRLETKFNNLIAKGYYVPKSFLKKQYILETKSAKVRFIVPQLPTTPDSLIKLTDADYQNFYNKNKGFFYQDEGYRDIDFVVFDVLPSASDRKKTAEDVLDLYKDFLTVNDIVNFTNANSDTKFDSTFVKKGKLPGKLDSIMFNAPVGTFVPPFELNNNWYMAKLLNVQERPDSMQGYQILVAFAGAGNDSIKRTKEQAKAKADSLAALLKKNPAFFSQIARAQSDYPTAKEDGGELKWFVDGDPNLAIFFREGINMKPKDIKVIETRIGYAIFELGSKTKPVKKVKTAVLARAIEPSNQTYQDTYMKASAFAGQNKTPEMFDKAAVQEGLRKRQSPAVKEMDNYLMGLANAREMVRWAYAETTKPGEVSPVFDVQGKYAVAVLKRISEKGLQPLENIKDRIEPSVKNYKRVEMLSEQMKKEGSGVNDINALGAKFNTKVDTLIFAFIGNNRSALAREGGLMGSIFTYKKGEIVGPLTGNYGAFYLIVDEVTEPAAKEDFTLEMNRTSQAFQGRVMNSLYGALQKTATIVDNRIRFY
ncbi:MAG: peptidylprolyl isomerase [bacterium]